MGIARRPGGSTRPLARRDRLRRDILSLANGAMVAWSLPAAAQQAVPVIGYLSSSSAQVSAPYLAFFRDDLRDSGYVEGGNVAIATRWTDGSYDRLPARADEVIE
jgi:putative ABC transport system substrate-binding protein